MKKQTDDEIVKEAHSRFDYIAYDDIAKSQQAVVKQNVVIIEQNIIALGASRSTENALQHLEECYMWIGKAIRDDQIQRNEEIILQEQRSNS